MEDIENARVQNSFQLKRTEQALEDNHILSVFDDVKHAQLAVQNQEKYLANSPFPHIFFDNFLPHDVAAAVASQYPKLESFNSTWKYHENDNVKRYFLENVALFSHQLRLFAAAVNSRTFLLFLETLGRFDSLLPDPYFMGGGAMVTETGGFLKIHADFNFHHKLQAWRRMNALFYLTPDWDRTWGANLELWSTDGKTKVIEIEPVFNRVVIFNTTSDSFHGQPEPIRCPPNRCRHVFSAFYYSVVKDARTENDPHFTKYALTNNPYAQQIGEDYKRSGY